VKLVEEPFLVGRKLIQWRFFVRKLEGKLYPGWEGLKEREGWEMCWLNLVMILSTIELSKGSSLY
jgi:hypothetical protein